MSEQRNISTPQEEELKFSSLLVLTVLIIMLKFWLMEWHSIIYYDGDITFDSIEIHNRALSEDEINDVFSIFGNYADRVLSKEELETIHKFLNDHSEIKKLAN